MASDGDWQKWGIPLIVICLLIILLLLIRWYIIRPMYKGNARIDGKTVLITGANTGIGKETALDLGKRGGRIVILCRDMVKGRAAADFIGKKIDTNVELHQLDLASLDSIRTCAEELKEKYPKIDILINNAGVMMTPQWKTKDGFEMQLGTNHLGHFLLTLLLIDNIKAASPSRIVNLASLAHEQGKMHWDDIYLEKSYSPAKSYGQSKLANILFTRSLAKKLNGTEVNTYALHPGVVKTELGRHLSRWLVIPLSLFRLFFKTPLQGAQTSIYCAVEPSLKTETGKYYSGCAPKRPTSRARNDEDAERLWKWSLEQVGLPKSFNP